MNFRGGASQAGGQRRAAVVDLTALIDVVFQLLIFFLLTSTYVSQQATASPPVPMEVPEASDEASSAPHDQVTITVSSEGQILFGDESVASLEELVPRLVEAKTKNPRVVALIRGHQNVNFGRIAAVTELIHATNIKLSTVRLPEE